MEEIKYNVQEEFNFDRWYFKIKGLKIKHSNYDSQYDPLPNAFFISLTDLQIIDLKRLSEKKINSKVQRKIQTESLWDSEDIVIYQELREYFDKRIEDYKNLTKVENPEFFLRLSGRSPKDILIHLLEPSRTGEDIAMRLTNSTRANFCFSEYLGLPLNFRSLKVILLPWDLQVNLGLEFRCFIHRRKLTAISQYDCYHAYDMLQTKSLQIYIKNSIEEFYEKMKCYIPFSSAIMDVVFKPLNYEEGFNYIITVPEDVTPNWCVHLLEFNPFYADVSSGASLFDWKRDFNILYFGLNTNKSVLRIKVKSKQTRSDKAHVLDIID